VALLLAADAPARRPHLDRKVDIELQDADIHSAIRLFADYGDFSFVVGDDVTGTVTLHLRHVQWDAAFAVFLHNKGLEALPVGDTWRIQGVGASP